MLHKACRIGVSCILERPGLITLKASTSRQQDEIQSGASSVRLQQQVVVNVTAGFNARLPQKLRLYFSFDNLRRRYNKQVPAQCRGTSRSNSCIRFASSDRRKTHSRQREGRASLNNSKQKPGCHIRLGQVATLKVKEPYTHVQACMHAYIPRHVGIHVGGLLRCKTADDPGVSTFANELCGRSKNVPALLVGSGSAQQRVGAEGWRADFIVSRRAPCWLTPIQAKKIENLHHVQKEGSKSILSQHGFR